MAARERRPVSAPQHGRGSRSRDAEGILPLLGKAVRDIEGAVQRGRVRESTRTTFQAVAVLVSEERTRVQTADLPDARRAEQLRHIDGIATTLARAAARDGSLLALLTEDAGYLSAADLGERLHISPAAVSGAVRYLVQIQLVRREREPGSRRDR